MSSTVSCPTTIDFPEADWSDSSLIFRSPVDDLEWDKSCVLPQSTRRYVYLISSVVAIVVLNFNFVINPPHEADFSTNLTDSTQNATSWHSAEDLLFQLVQIVDWSSDLFLCSSTLANCCACISWKPFVDRSCDQHCTCFHKHHERIYGYVLIVYRHIHYRLNRGNTSSCL